MQWCAAIILFPALCQGAETELEFCDALDTLLADGSSNPSLPAECSVHYCTAVGASYNCLLVHARIMFDSTSSIELCTDPPRY